MVCGRPSLVDLRWDQIDFTHAVLHVRRAERGTPATHPIVGDEMRALRKLQREKTKSPFVFTSEQEPPFTTAGFARMVERAAAEAELGCAALLTCCAKPVAVPTVDDSFRYAVDMEGYGLLPFFSEEKTSRSRREAGTRSTKVNGGCREGTRQ